MRKYETIVVFNSALGENELNAEVSRVQALLESNGAKDVEAQRWGRKEIAYTVKKQKFGNFVAFEYASEQSDTVDKSSRVLVIMDSVLKFQTHTVSDKHRKVKTNPKAVARRGEGEDAAADF